MKTSIVLFMALALVVLGVNASPPLVRKRSVVNLNPRAKDDSKIIPKFNASIDLDENDKIIISHKPNTQQQKNQTESIAEPNQQKPEVDHYDQRQNGTENYRVKVDGLVFILAPADTLLLGAALDPSFSSLITENKPKPKPEIEILKPKPDKEDTHKNLNPEHHSSKSRLRISNLLRPFLNRIQHSQQQLGET